MATLNCPHCGGVLATIGGSDVEPARPPAQAAGEGPSTSHKDGKWRIECPKHGWHAARLWPADKGMPAVVKCTAADEEDPSGYCVTKVLASVAKRRAGLGGE